MSDNTCDNDVPHQGALGKGPDDNISYMGLCFAILNRIWYLFGACSRLGHFSSLEAQCLFCFVDNKSSVSLITC